MALTKSGALIDAWAEVAAANYRKGAAADVTANYDHWLLIDACLSSTNAMGSAPEIWCQMSKETAEPTTQDGWENFAPFSGPTGTAVTTALSADEAAGQTVLSSTNPVTAGFDDVRKLIFIEDTVDVTKSEIVLMVASEDAGDIITIMEGLTNAHTAAGSALFTTNDAVPGSAVKQYTILVPASARWVRVVVLNHDADATLHTRTQISRTTTL